MATKITPPLTIIYNLTTICDRKLKTENSLQFSDRYFLFICIKLFFSSSKSLKIPSIDRVILFNVQPLDVSRGNGARRGWSLLLKLIGKRGAVDHLWVAADVDGLSRFPVASVVAVIVVVVFLFNSFISFTSFCWNWLYEAEDGRSEDAKEDEEGEGESREKEKGV